ncbi:MAG TPA: sugar isomerase [Actinomycetes bacterium]|nr:sugar isomerase [Actinomycetes bacterium]
MTAGSFLEVEIASQPACWRQALGALGRWREALPRSGERVAVVGCGTSWFVAQAYAVLREQAGLGLTDAFAASEMPPGRGYDRLLAITRSGTTTEVLDLLAALRGRCPTVAITAGPATPVQEFAGDSVVLDFADEHAVVQTRFATTTLALLRAHLGQDLAGPLAEAEQALAADLPSGALQRSQFTFLGRGWSVGLANEAALKLREAALAWAESYPAMEYRHGPVSISDAGSVVWFFGEPPQGLADEAARTGALVVAEPRDPMAELVRVQRLAVVIALAKGLDPDKPRHLARSVVLQSGTASPRVP